MSVICGRGLIILTAPGMGFKHLRYKIFSFDVKCDCMIWLIYFNIVLMSVERFGGLCLGMKSSGFPCSSPYWGILIAH